MNQESKQSDTERRILEAALEVFAEKGRDGARMHEIASRAEINSALLHYYFGSKVQLFEHVLLEAMRRFIQSLSSLLEEGRPFVDLLRRFIDGYIDFALENVHIVRLIIADNLNGSTTAASILSQMKHMPDSPPSRFIQAVRAASARGEIREVDPEQTLVSVISCCLYFIVVFPTLELILPGAGDRPAFIQQRKEHLFDLLYNGLRADTS